MFLHCVQRWQIIYLRQRSCGAGLGTLGGNRSSAEALRLDLGAINYVGVRHKKGVKSGECGDGGDLKFHWWQRWSPGELQALQSWTFLLRSNAGFLGSAPGNSEKLYFCKLEHLSNNTNSSPPPFKPYLQTILLRLKQLNAVHRLLQLPEQR